MKLDNCVFLMKEFVISTTKKETAILVGLITSTQNERKTNEYLDELEFLAQTAGAEVVKRFTQRIDHPHPVTYVGTGKLTEIAEYIEMLKDSDDEIGMVIFDDELSAKQLRNIEKELKIKILDRTSLILDIFAMRAQTAHAKVQVELAQYKYMLPRLQRLWTHLERQGGGSGSGSGKGGSVGLRGPGETQLEMDRRIILGRMSLLKEQLSQIDRQKSIQRKNRGRLIRVALVGYTNVGKSTLMNLLAKSEVFAENKLFATLDTQGIGNGQCVFGKQEYLQGQKPRKHKMQWAETMPHQICPICHIQKDKGQNKAESVRDHVGKMEAVPDIVQLSDDKACY